MKKQKPSEHILTLTCPDRRGIVRAVSGVLADNGCNILDSAQFSDVATNTFFMRVHFADETGGGRGLPEKLRSVADEFALEWHLHDAGYKPRVLLMVSKIGHCLNDLLHRYSSGLLHADVRAVVSNHEDFRSLTESHGIVFHHLPVIEQDVSRVGHAMSVKEFTALGRDVESVVLARAVNWFVQHRILLNGDKTIIFR